MPQPTPIPAPPTNTSLSSLPPPPLPPSVEASYRQKCITLKRRMAEVSESNDAYHLRKVRLERGILKLRLERAFLLEQLAKRTSENVEDSEGSPSPPPTVLPPSLTLSPLPFPFALETHPRPRPSILPTLMSPTRKPKEKPLRIKRGHRRPTDTDLLPPLPSLDDALPSSPPLPPPSSQPEPAAKPAKKAAAAARAASGRPTNAYMIFCAALHDDVLAEHEDEEGFEIAGALARRWRDLGSVGQEKWFEVYEERKREWEEKKGGRGRKGKGRVEEVDMEEGEGEGKGEAEGDVEMGMDEEEEDSLGGWAGGGWSFGSGLRIGSASVV